MSMAYLDVGASQAFGDMCSTTSTSSADFAGLARQALVAGQLDVGPADIVDNLAKMLELLSGSIDEITLGMQNADSSGLFGLVGANPLTSQLEMMLADFKSGALGVVPAQVPIDLDDPDDLADRWPDLTEEERQEIACALTIQESEKPGQERLQDLVDEWKQNLSTKELDLFYRDVAACRAGIDLDEWDPNKGFAANEDIAEKIYKYYGDMFASDPDIYRWAGMGAMVGPGFIAGMKALPSIADKISDPKVLAAMEAAGMIPPNVLPPGSTTVGMTLTSADLRWYEAQFMRMQQGIFFDMAAKHEAFRDGGADQVARMIPDTDKFKNETVQAFRYMEDGVNLNEAARLLVIREQKYTIGKQWDEMRERKPFGYPITYAMSMLGHPSIPNTKSYAEKYPLGVGASASLDVELPSWLPGVNVDADTSVSLKTPFPNGNVSQWKDRWKLIENDTLPRYIELIENDPDRAVELATGSANERSDDYAVNLDSAFDDLKNWDLDADASVDLDWQWGVVGDVGNGIRDGFGRIFG